MRAFVGVTIVVGVLGCHGAEHASDRQYASQLVAGGMSRTDTTPGGDVLVTEGDSFVHLQKWTEHDSLIGAFIKLGHARNGRDASDSTLPGTLRPGRTSTAVIRTELGTPAHIRSTADTAWLEYASPFIGPDEAVIFVVVRDTLHRVRWQLYSE